MVSLIRLVVCFRETSLRTFVAFCETEEKRSRRRESIPNSPEVRHSVLFVFLRKDVRHMGVSQNVDNGRILRT